ncbi:Uncharacterised protein [uncultured Blautia sp.]|uniref:hypothetical protein n=1 Tax=Blautia acetigignens TaxID=2981783 RepID=UPI00082096F1|nr:hypothetical protein [Blautia acetigignens]MCU6774555.1 hypothetical protein [Blautia acetigignens]SCH47072.1 Uncharacterised protein [uncultured Blautia sp.]
MKKKLLFVSLTAVSLTLSHPIGVIASSEVKNETSDSANQSEISFRGLPWWGTKQDTEKVLVESGAEILSAAFENDILRMGGIDFINTTSGKDRVDGGGIVSRYSGIEVAGYKPSDTYACYIYQLNSDGSIDKTNENALFYFGWYTFSSNDYIDGEGVYNDLSQKLTSLYGDGEVNDESDYNTTTTWQDYSNNQIRLLLGGKTNDAKYVTLGYMAADADSKLDEMQASLNAESASQEAQLREENKNNTSGL